MKTLLAALSASIGGIFGRVSEALVVGLPLGIIFAGFGLPSPIADWTGVFLSSIPVYYGSKIGSGIFNRKGEFKGSRTVVAVLAAASLFVSATFYTTFIYSLIPENVDWNYATANFILPTLAAFLGSLSGLRPKKIMSDDLARDEENG